MPTRAAVPGLLKHQIMFDHAAAETAVTTLWTWKNVDPIPTARVVAERAQIEAWLNDNWRTRAATNIWATKIKTWDFGSAVPAKYADELVFPKVQGTGGGELYLAFCAVVALRTQPIGSEIRNRINGRIFHPVGLGNFSATQRINAITNPEQIDAVYENLLTRLDPTVADCGDWSVVSFFVDGAPRVVPLIVPVDHCLCRAQPGIQRRRVPKAAPYPLGA